MDVVVCDNAHDILVEVTGRAGCHVSENADPLRTTIIFCPVLS
jgi:hypothetical protein